jgi:hypothetical protein
MRQRNLAQDHSFIDPMRVDLVDLELTPADIVEMLKQLKFSNREKSVAKLFISKGVRDYIVRRLEPR